MRVVSVLRCVPVLVSFACVQTASASAQTSSDFAKKMEFETASLLQAESVASVESCYAHAVYLKDNAPESTHINQNYRIWRLAASQKYISYELADAEIEKFSMKFPSEGEDASLFKYYDETSLRCQKLWMAAYKSSYQKALNALGLGEQ